MDHSSAKNPFFAMVLFSASVFILTILAMVAVIFSDPRAPVARFFEAHAGRLIAAEVVVTLIVGFIALAVDRLQSRRAGSPKSKALEPTDQPDILTQRPQSPDAKTATGKEDLT